MIKVILNQISVLLLFILVILSTVTIIAQESEEVLALPWILSLDWSVDGTKIAVSSGVGQCDADNADEYVVNILDGSTGQIINTISGHKCPVYAVAFSPDGSKIAGVLPGRVTIWNTANGQQINSTSHINSIIDSLSWSSSGAQIAVNLGGQVRILNSTTAQYEMIHFPIVGVEAIVWSPNGAKLVSGDVDQQARIWDPTNGQVLLTFSGHPDSVMTVDWSPDSTNVVTGSGNELRIWNVVTGELIRTLQGHTDQVQIVVWSPDGTQIASGSNDGTVRVWNVITGEQIAVLTHPGPVYALAWSPDGTKLVYGGKRNDGQDDTVRIVPAICDFSIAPSDVSGLKAAITSANGNGTPDTICLSRSTYTLTTVDNTDDGDNGLPVITSDITIYGNGATITRDAGAPAFRLFKVNAGGTLTLENLTVSGGWAAGYGGAAYVKGSLVADNVTFTGNHAEDDGGAIYSTGTLTLRGSRFEGNTSGSGRTVARRP